MTGSASDSSMRQLMASPLLGLRDQMRHWARAPAGASWTGSSAAGVVKVACCPPVDASRPAGAPIGGGGVSAAVRCYPLRGSAERRQHAATRSPSRRVALAAKQACSTPKAGGLPRLAQVPAYPGRGSRETAVSRPQTGLRCCADGALSGCLGVLVVGDLPWRAPLDPRRVVVWGW